MDAYAVADELSAVSSSSGADHTPFAPRTTASGTYLASVGTRDDDTSWRRPLVSNANSASAPLSRVALLAV
jgi:hypothetical protein